MSKQQIYGELMEKHYDYYCTVYYEFIYDAIINTLHDFRFKTNYTIEDIHKNIIENYI